jgi:hypothetical protein
MSVEATRVLQDLRRALLNPPTQLRPATPADASPSAVVGAVA